MFSETKEIYEFGPFRLDIGQHKFERADGTSKGTLPEKAFQTLVFLVRNQGRLVTKNELLDAIWPDTAVEENNLNKSIHAIRQALGEEPRGQKYIETIPKHGFRFVTPVTKIGDGKPIGFAAEADPDETDHLVERVVRPYPKNGNSAAGPVGDRIEDIENLKTRRDSDRRRNFLLLIAAAVVVGVAGLGWFVMGRLQAVERSISSTSSDSRSTTENGVTDSARSRAYDHYVRGKVKAGSENREDTEAAIKILEEAVAIDPTFAEAFAQLARAYNTSAFKFSEGDERKRYHENAEVAIEKALALDPDLAEAHFARGLILWTNTKRFPHEQAIQSFKRSLALDPKSDETHHQLSIVFGHIGLLDEAQRSLTNALQINPNNTMARYRVGVYTAWQGKFDEATAVFKTIPSDVSPMLIDRSMAELLVQTGRLSEAEKLVDDYLARYPQDEGGSFTSVKALLLAKAGRQNEAEAAIQHAVQIGTGFGHFHHTAYNIASAYVALNNPGEAVKWLEAAAEGGFPNYSYFEIDPNLDNIRNDPRFIEMMKELKPQWERFKALA
jgi:DNA-binding winged helix-turn-helix (wHTH) protein/Flp pilus assembly protein TadD